MTAHTAREALQEFSVWLETERRASPNTIEAYQRDIANFIAFLVDHLGGEPHVSDLKGLSRHDVVAWLARRRSQDNLAASSRARAASSLRAFFKFLDRRLDMANAKAMMFESPRRPHRLPRPLPLRNGVVPPTAGATATTRNKLLGRLPPNELASFLALSDTVATRLRRQRGPAPSRSAAVGAGDCGRQVPSRAEPRFRPLPVVACHAADGQAG